MSKSHETMKQRLLLRKAELDELSQNASEERAAVKLDQQSVGRLSRMDALQGQAMAQATERQRQAELTRIELALRAISEDEYGYCENCGEEIAAKRLEIDPAALQCVACAGRR